MSELSVLLRSPDPMTFCVQRFKFPGKVLDWLCYSPDATAPSLGASRGNVGWSVAAHLENKQNLIFPWQHLVLVCCARSSDIELRGCHVGSWVVSPHGCYFDSNVPGKISDNWGELGTWWEVTLWAAIEFERAVCVARDRGDPSFLSPWGLGLKLGVGFWWCWLYLSG